MAAPQRQTEPRYTVDYYLAMERASEERHVYIDGLIRAMAGESGAHADISTNIVGLLFNQLKGKPCRARTKDTRVRSGPAPTPGRSMKGLYSYPDALVICEEPEFADHYLDILLNPKVIVEVLSDSTEAFDRGEKFQRFRQWNPSLTDYVLVAQHRPQVDHYRRNANGSSWTLDSYDGLEAELVIASIECRLPLKDVYDRVVFPAAAQ